MLRVLIIDDEEVIRKSMVNYFEDLEYDVCAVGSAEEAVQALQGKSWDAMIVDLRLPGKSGDDFIREVYHQTDKTVFIIYSGTINYVIEGEMQKFSRLSQTVLRKPLAKITDLPAEIERLRCQQ